MHCSLRIILDLADKAQYSLPPTNQRTESQVHSSILVNTASLSLESSLQREASVNGAVTAPPVLVTIGYNGHCQPRLQRPKYDTGQSVILRPQLIAQSSVEMWRLSSLGVWLGLASLVLAALNDTVKPLSLPPSGYWYVPLRTSLRRVVNYWLGMAMMVDGLHSTSR